MMMMMMMTTSSWLRQVIAVCWCTTAA